jgi:uncharacterized protein YcaQ
LEQINITNEHARRFLLTYQGLFPPYAKTAKKGVMDYIRRVNCIQFDPLNIVGRNPDLVLQSRIDDYKPEMLASLLYEDRKLIDGWDKMMSIYPVEDWPNFHRYRTAMRNHYGRENQPASAVLPQIRDELRQRGPLSSIDVTLDAKVNWHWGPTRMARAAMESMYAWGELIVHHKVNTRKVYDFAANHISTELLTADDPFLSEEDYHDWHISRRLGSVGIMWNRGSNTWLAIHGVKSKQRDQAIQRLLEKQEIREVKVDDMPYPLHIRSSELELLETTRDGDSPTPQATFIAPLDNIMWGRNFINALFGFKYRWEVYVPAAKRVYGYYVLPILYGDRFIGRFEPGWEKKERTLIIKQWWWESGTEVDDSMKEALIVCMQRFLRFREAVSLQIDPEAIKNAGIEWMSKANNGAS